MRKVDVLVAGLFVGLMAGPVSAAEPQPTTELASPDAGGTDFDEGTCCPSISGDGRVVAFMTTPEGPPHVYAYYRETDRLEKVSIAPKGQAPLGRGYDPAISADGRFVVFASPAIYVRDLVENTTERIAMDGADPDISADGRFVSFTTRLQLVPEDTRGTSVDIYRYDRSRDVFERVSTRVKGSPLTTGVQYVYRSKISANGRFVAFDALESRDTGTTEVLLRDMDERASIRVSVNSHGRPANRGGDLDDLSASGRFVVFTTTSTNLAPNDTNGTNDVYVRDRELKITRRVSVTSTERQLGRGGSDGSISADGQRVAFETDARVTENDTNNTDDIYLRDRAAGTTRRVSVAKDGSERDDRSIEPSLSTNGRFVAFASDAELVGQDNWGTDIFIRGPLP